MLRTIEAMRGLFLGPFLAWALGVGCVRDAGDLNDLGNVGKQSSAIAGTTAVVADADPTLPARAVCQIIGCGGACTGAIIDREFVLTARHCICTPCSSSSPVDGPIGPPGAESTFHLYLPGGSEVGTTPDVPVPKGTGGLVVKRVYFTDVWKTLGVSDCAARPVDIGIQQLPRRLTKTELTQVMGRRRRRAVHFIPLLSPLS